MKIRTTLNRTLAGMGIFIGASQLSAETLVITTGDCGDGTPGLGADGWLSENSEASLRGKSGMGRCPASSWCALMTNAKILATFALTSPS